MFTALFDFLSLWEVYWVPLKKRQFPNTSSFSSVMVVTTKELF